MQIKQGADVYTAAGDKVGHIDRLALNPRTKEITHLVIRQGLILPKDKILPMGWVAEAGEDRVVLKQNAQDFDALPDYQEQYFVPMAETYMDATVNTGYVPAFYWYPPAGGIAVGPVIDDVRYDETPAYVGTPQTVLGDSVAIKEGAAVITADGEHVGDVEKLILDSHTEQVRDIVISRGGFTKKYKRIPALWLDTATETEVRLAVEDRILEQVPDYREQ